MHQQNNVAVAVKSLSHASCLYNINMYEDKSTRTRELWHNLHDIIW